MIFLLWGVKKSYDFLVFKRLYNLQYKGLHAPINKKRELEQARGLVVSSDFL